MLNTNMEREIFICGDSYAAQSAGRGKDRDAWYNYIGGSYVNHAKGGTPWDYTAYQLYMHLDPVRHHAVVVSLTNSSRIWWNYTLEDPTKSNSYRDRNIANMIQNYSNIPEWETRTTITALQVLKNISNTVPVYVIAPFLEQVDSAYQQYDKCGMWPTLTRNFHVLPVNLNQLRQDNNSNDLNNHLPKWAHKELASAIRRWISKRRTGIRRFKLNNWRYKNIGVENAS